LVEALWVAPSQPGQVRRGESFVWAEVSQASANTERQMGASAGAVALARLGAAECGFEAWRAAAALM
jgi:hypothetical protein